MFMNSHENFDSMAQQMPVPAGAASMGRRINMQQNKNVNVTVSLGHADQTGSSIQNNPLIENSETQSNAFDFKPQLRPRGYGEQELGQDYR